jgi:dephospho-CoA kinase
MKPTPESPGRGKRWLPRVRPLVVAVTGGIGAGKSSFCRLLAALPGVHHLDADAIAHRLLEQDARVRALVCDRFGSGILDAQGAISRARLAALVFGAAGERRALEAILHPAIKATLASEVARLKLAAGVAIVVVEIPLLLESGIPDWCNWVVAVEAPRDMRLGRLAAKGLARAETERRMSQQADEQARREIADEVIINDGDLARLEELAEARWQAWRSARE